MFKPLLFCLFWHTQLTPLSHVIPILVRSHLSCVLRLPNETIYRNDLGKQQQNENDHKCVYLISHIWRFIVCAKTRRRQKTIFVKIDISRMDERHRTHGLLNKTVTLLRSSKVSWEGSLRQCSQLPTLVPLIAYIVTALGNRAKVLAKTLA